MFVDGKFWHGHPSAYRPGQHGDYWDAKIARNMERDRAVDAELGVMGWTVIRIWDFEVRRQLDDCLERVEAALDPAYSRGG